MGVAESGLKSAFNLSRAYHNCKLDFVVDARVCWCRSGELIRTSLAGPKSSMPGSLGVPKRSVRRGIVDEEVEKGGDSFGKVIVGGGGDRLVSWG